MDRPVLHAFVDELVDEERLAAFAEALPTRARVSEPALPLLLASLHERLDAARGGDEKPGALGSTSASTGGLVCALPEDADARDAAEAAAWFLGEDRVALLPSRGVGFGSGLEPPPHLVGERARALAVLEAGGLVCASAAAVAEPLPPPAARPRSVERAVVYPAAERRLDLVEPTLDDAPIPADLVPPLPRDPDLVFRPDEVRARWEDDFPGQRLSFGAAELDPLPAAQPHGFEAQRP